MIFNYNILTISFFIPGDTIENKCIIYDLSNCHDFFAKFSKKTGASSNETVSSFNFRIMKQKDVSKRKLNAMKTNLLHRVSFFCTFK